MAYSSIYIACWLYITILMCVYVQLLSPVQLFVTPWTAEHQAYLTITIYQS